MGAQICQVHTGTYQNHPMILFQTVDRLAPTVANPTFQRRHQRVSGKNRYLFDISRCMDCNGFCFMSHEGIILRLSLETKKKFHLSVYMCGYPFGND